MPSPPITEAAGLLQSGAIFSRRVGLRSSDDPGADPTILAGFKRGGFSTYFEDAPICHFDLEGRWQRAFIAGTHYLKGLNATVRAVDRVREANQLILRRRTLSRGETETLDAQIAGLARRLVDGLDASIWMPPPAPSRPIDPPDLRAILSKIAGWDSKAWANHQALYRQAYGSGPPPFLPPDCPNPVILQPGEGMAVASCADQARTVVSLLGLRLNQCRDLFLTGTGWINRPDSEVLSLLFTINDVLPIHPNQGRPRASDVGEAAPRLETIHAWVEDCTATAPSADAWRQYRAAHLGRVTLRLDSRSVSHADALRSTVGHLKAAGIGVGLALFVDGSGESSPEAFAGLVASLPLKVGDLIALIDDRGENFDEAITSDPASVPFLDDWKAQVVAALPSKGPRVVIYNPDKQWI